MLVEKFLELESASDAKILTIFSSNNFERNTNSVCSFYSVNLTSIDQIAQKLHNFINRRTNN